MQRVCKGTNVRTQVTKVHERDGSWTGCLCTPPQVQPLRIWPLLAYLKLLVLSRLPDNINALVVHTDIPFHVSLLTFSYPDPVPAFLQEKALLSADLFGITPVLLRTFPWQLMVSVDHGRRRVMSFHIRQPCINGWAESFSSSLVSA